MSCTEIRHDAPMRQLDDRVISRAAGLALVLYGAISLALIVALAASAGRATTPTACWLSPAAVSSLDSTAVPAQALTRQAQAQ